MSYSVAIRTLGKSGNALKRELISLHSQTLPPEKIIIYIAKGYSRPDFQIGIEEYVEVEKGMVAQRALQYREITSQYIMLLDDDVELAPNSAEILLNELHELSADCVAVDSFQNHKMSFLSKLKAAIGGLVFPHSDKNWAFKLHSNGSFSYINDPQNRIYRSQSAAGPASLWRKEKFLSLYLEDEKWLDRLGFPYGEDELLFYKLHINGGKLYVSFDSGVLNLDGKSASSEFQLDPRKFYVRGMSNGIRWYRMHYEPLKRKKKKVKAYIGYIGKSTWIGSIYFALSVLKLNPKIFKSYIGGLRAAKKYVHSEEYKKIPSFILS